jgi:hypothetical protein
MTETRRVVLRGRSASQDAILWFRFQLPPVLRISTGRCWNGGGHEDARTVARASQTIGEAWEKECSLLLPLPPSDYECCDMVTVRLNPYSQAQYETNRYSVPVKHARRTVTLKAYPFTIAHPGRIASTSQPPPLL